MLVSNSSILASSPFNAFIAVFNSLQYKSYPTASICPCCSAPKTFPAPLISKSRIAIFIPEPNSVNSLIAFKRLVASSFSSLPLLYSIKA